MSKIILKAEATRVVQKNDRGIVTYRKRYKRGDVVDVSYIEDAQVERLLASGALAYEDEEDTDDAESELAADAARARATSSTGSVADLGTTATQAGGVELESDEYDDMGYSDLQGLAKSRDLNAGGSAEDLRARLREDDADSEDDESEDDDDDNE